MVYENQQVQKAKGQANQAQSEADARAAQLKQDILSQPQQLSPDNFLSSKLRSLTNMRLGLASTIIPSASGAPAASLYAPSLSSRGPGKAKLGA